MKKPCIWPSKRRLVDADTVLRQPLGVGLALVAQRVVLGREHHGGRQAGEGAGAQRRGVRARAHRRVGRVVIPEPRHRVAAHDQLVGGIEVGVAVQVAVGDRIHEHLQRDLGPGLAGPLRDDRGEASAGAVAGDDQRHRAARDLLEVRRRPLERRPCVLDRRGVAMLGGEAVVDQDDRAAGPGGEPAGERVELVRRTEHPPAAVVVDDHATCAPVRDEEPSELDVLHPRHLRAAAVELGHPGARLARRSRGQLVQRRQPALRHRSEERRARLVQHRSHAPESGDGDVLGHALEGDLERHPDLQLLVRAADDVRASCARPRRARRRRCCTGPRPRRRGRRPGA